MSINSLRSKPVHGVIAAVLTVVVFLFLYFYIGINQKLYTYEDSKRIARELSRNTATDVEAHFVKAWQVAQSIAEKSVIYQQEGADRGKIVDLLKKSFNTSNEILSVWTMWEPGQYDGLDSSYRNSSYFDSEGHLNIGFFVEDDSVLSEQTNPGFYDEDFYVIPKQKKTGLILEPYLYQYGGSQTIYYETSVVFPILIDSVFKGVVGVDLDLKAMQWSLSEKRIFKRGFIALLSPSGEIVTHSDTSYIGENFFSLIGDNENHIPYSFTDNQEISFEDFSSFLNEKVLRFFYPIRVGNNQKHWTIMVEIPKREATIRSIQLEYIALGTVVLGLILLFYLVINILDRIKYEKQIVQAKVQAEQGEEALKILYNELLASEEETRAANEELYAKTEALRESNQQLIRAKEAAEENDRLKTAFLQNISHEIRTPLNAICGFSQFLSASDISNETRNEYLEIIHNNTQQLLSIIEDTVTLSTLETGQVKTYYSKVSINNIIDDAKAIFKTRVNPERVSFKIVKPLLDKEVEIYSDKTKITQVLSNLLSNAVKFTSDGIIEFGYTHKDHMFEFFVKDSGIGIDPDKHQIIFDRFVQADEGIHLKYGGTGLGLSICKGFVELLGGEIWVESESGKGAAFFFTIPGNKSPN